MYDTGVYIWFCSTSFCRWYPYSWQTSLMLAHIGLCNKTRGSSAVSIDTNAMTWRRRGVLYSQSIGSVQCCDLSSTAPWGDTVSRQYCWYNASINVDHARDSPTRPLLPIWGVIFNLPNHYGIPVAEPRRRTPAPALRLYTYIGCGTNKSNPLSCLINISTTNRNFKKKSLHHYFSFISTYNCQIMLNYHIIWLQGGPKSKPDN